MGFSKLRRRHFDLCHLRRLLSDVCCRAVRSTTGRYDRRSSSSASGMEVAADPEYVPRRVCPTNLQRAQAARERSNRKLCRRQGRRAFSDARPFVSPLTHQRGATTLRQADYSSMLDLELAVRSTRRVLQLANNRSTRTGNRYWLSGFDNACGLRRPLVRVGAG